jgi:hypothetical protein
MFHEGAGMLSLEPSSLSAFYCIPLHPHPVYVNPPRALVSSKGFHMIILGNISARRLEENTSEYATEANITA